MRFFFDIDGTLAQFDASKSLEEVAKKGYFRTVTPIPNMIQTIENLIKKNYPVYILSAVFADGHSREDKKAWIQANIPTMPMENILFATYGEEKSAVIHNPSPSDILIDDFTPNLLQWHGIGIKVYNGINGTKGRWKGYSIYNRSTVNCLVNQILGIAKIEEELSLNAQDIFPV